MYWFLEYSDTGIGEVSGSALVIPFPRHDNPDQASLLGPVVLILIRAALIYLPEYIEGNDIRPLYMPGDSPTILEIEQPRNDWPFVAKQGLVSYTPL